MWEWLLAMLPELFGGAAAAATPIETAGGLAGLFGPAAGAAVVPELPLVGAPTLATLGMDTAAPGVAGLFGAPSISAAAEMGLDPTVMQLLQPVANQSSSGLLGYGKAALDKLTTPQGLLAMSLMNGGGGEPQRVSNVQRPPTDTGPAQIAPRFNAQQQQPYGRNAYDESMRRFLMRRKFGMGA